MAEKIEMFAGWDWDGSAIVGRERNIHIDKECTVVVHDGKAERVFTASEVRAYEKDLMRALSDPGAFTPRHVEQHPLQHFEETGPQWVSRARAVVRAKHGLSDPA